MKFHWHFAKETGDAVGHDHATHGRAFLVEPYNSDGTELTDEQVAALGNLGINLHINGKVLNSSFPCPPICPE